MRYTLLVIGLAAILAGCNDGQGSPTPTSGSTALTVVPKAVAEACHRAASVTPSITVQCPTFIPRPSPRLAAEFPHLYKLRSMVANTANRQWYDFWLMYGAPSGEGHQTNGAARFLHLELAAGRDGTVEWAGLSAGATQLGRATLGGHRGVLYHQQPYPQGGQWGDHYFFKWMQEGVNYYVSVHSWGSRRAAIELLGKIIAGLRPISQIAA